MLLPRARDDSSIGVIILTGEGEKRSVQVETKKLRGHGGYVGEDQIPRLNVLRSSTFNSDYSKASCCYGSWLCNWWRTCVHIVCDLTIAADNAIFGQTGPRVGSFDAGYGSGYLARIIGHKKAREIWYLCRQYNAQEALDMGLSQYSRSI